MKPNRIWANAINLSGLWSRTPLECFWNDELASWWDESGDLKVVTLGISHEENYVICSSVDESKVAQWTNGAVAALTMVHNWSRVI